MTSIFSSVYDVFKGFFNRVFWFGTFLPVVVFTSLHVMIFCLAFDAPASFFGLTLDLPRSVSGDAAAWTGLLVALVIASYALVPFLPLLEGLLNGSLLPPLLHDWLRARRIVQSRHALKILDTALAELGQLQAMDDDLSEQSGRIKRAYAQALDLTASQDQGAVEDAEAKLKLLDDALIEQKSSLFCIAASAETAVLAALAKNSPAYTRFTDDQAIIARRTHAIADRFKKLITQARGEAAYRYRIAQTRFRTARALEAPRATLFGDASLLVEIYSYKTYNVDFDFLWPRLFMSLKSEKNDDPIKDRIEEARSPINFAITSLLLSISIPALWLPVLIANRGSPWLFFTIGMLTPIMLSFFYRILFEAQLAFGNVVETTIDRSRFLVLGMLRQPEPMSLSEERALWARIKASTQNNRHADLVYTIRNENLSK